MRTKKNLTKFQKIKKLNVFLTIEKKKHLLLKSGTGIKFLIGFRKNLYSSISEYNFAGFFSIIDRNNFIKKIFILNSFIRFFSWEDKIKTIFFKNFPIQKNFPIKIFIEESVDEFKIYLDENLIRLAIKNNPFVGKCWLSIKSDPFKNRNFWHQFLDSCFKFMTGIIFSQEKSLFIDYINMSLEKKVFKDLDLENLRNPGNRIENFPTYDQLINHDLAFGEHEKTHKTLENRNYLRGIKWRNRIYSKKKSRIVGGCIPKKIEPHLSNLLLC